MRTFKRQKLTICLKTVLGLGAVDIATPCSKVSPRNLSSHTNQQHHCGLSLDPLSLDVGAADGRTAPEVHQSVMVCFGRPLQLAAASS